MKTESWNTARKPYVYYATIFDWSIIAVSIFTWEVHYRYWTILQGIPGFSQDLPPPAIPGIHFNPPEISMLLCVNFFVSELSAQHVVVIERMHLFRHANEAGVRHGNKGIILYHIYCNNLIAAAFISRLHFL